MIPSKLRGKIPTTIQKRFKAMLFGEAGVGKTTCAILFPKPYFIDTERGAENDQYVQALEKNGGAIFQTQDFQDLLQEVKTLANIKHDYQTLVIDPITTIYSNLLDDAERKKGDSHGKHYAEANKQIKKLLDLLMRLDMNIIVTAHSKKEYGDKMNVLGSTFDGYKKLDHLFDLVIEIKRADKRRVGFVRKSRIAAFEDGSEFDFNYKEIASRYDKKLLEKESTPIFLASIETLKALKEQLNTNKTTELQLDRWLAKKERADVTELSEKEALELIASLKEQYNKTLEKVEQL